MLHCCLICDPGLRKEKQYFVKYRGLAHIHNQWIPESRLSPEAEKLIEEFNKEREVKHIFRPLQLLKFTIQLTGIVE